MYSSRRDTLLVTSLTDSLLLPTLTRTDTRSAGQQTSAVPVTWSSLQRLPGPGRLAVGTSSPRSFSLPANSWPEAGSIAANTRLGLLSMVDKLPAAMAIGEMHVGICSLVQLDMDYKTVFSLFFFLVIISDGNGPTRCLCVWYKILNKD